MLPMAQQDVVETPRGRNLRLFRSNSRRKLSPLRHKSEIMILKHPLFLFFAIGSLLLGLWSISALMMRPYIPSPELNHHHQQQAKRENVSKKMRHNPESVQVAKEQLQRRNKKKHHQDVEEEAATARERLDREKEHRESKQHHVEKASPKDEAKEKEIHQERLVRVKEDREITQQHVEKASPSKQEKDSVIKKEVQQPPMAQEQLVNSNEIADNNNNKFVCPTADSNFHFHQPVVVLTQAHSGTDALLHLMAQNPQILVLSDLFTDDRQQVPLLVRLIDQLKQNCQIGDPDVLYTPRQETFGQDIHALFASIMTEHSGSDLYLELIQKFQNRFLRPWQWLAFIRKIPSVHSHFVFLLQRDDWRHFHMPLEAFLLELQQHDSVFVVVYRQHLLQTYAAYQRALLEGHSSDPPADGKIVVEKEAMETFMEKTRTFYNKIRFFLQTKAPSQSLVLEYQRDLANANELLATWSKIQSLLQLPATQQHLQLPDFSPDVPLPEQIMNWNQIQDEWGYAEEWPEDLFGIKSHQNSPVKIPNNDTSLVDPPADSEDDYDIEQSEFVCAATEAHPHKPVFVFGTPRTGSNLVFNFLVMLGIVWPDADVLNLIELLSPHANYSLKLFALSQIIDHLKEKCQVGDRAMRYFPRYQDFRTPDDMFVSLMTEHSGTKLFRKLQQQFGKRHDNPMELIQFLQKIPSPKQSYFAFKVFPEHLKQSSQAFISKIPPDSVVIVLWRRNLLEAYVSLQIALSTNHWMNVETTAEDAVTVDKAAFENYVTSTKLFYHQIQTAFAENNVTFTAFEYHTDLSDTSRQQETIRHLQHLLQHTPDSKVTHDVMQGLWTTKQASVPLQERILNWEDIVNWGYDRPTEDWENLFP